MALSREKILEECRTEAPIFDFNDTCPKCNGSGWVQKANNNFNQTIARVTCPQCRKPPCSRCKGMGRVKIGRGYDEEVCPICGGDPSYITLKEVLEDARKTVESWETHSGASLLNCPDCGGSLCVEEYHDCDRDSAWRREHY